MSKKRSIATFSDVAQLNENSDNVNDNVNVYNNNDNIMLSIVKAPASNKKPTGIYFDEDVLEVLQQVTKPHGRGAQSKLVNEVLKKYLIEKGFLNEVRE